MLQTYYRSWKRIDAIKGTWLGPQIERYVEHLGLLLTSEPSVHGHVNMIIHFGDFAREHGARQIADLPLLVEDFVASRVKHHHHWCRSEGDARLAASICRTPIERFLQTALPDFKRTRREMPIPFAEAAPGFFEHLARTRGLSEETRKLHVVALRAFEQHLRAIERALPEITPEDVTNFVIERGKTLAKGSMRFTTSSLRVFFHYAYAERIIPRDLEFAVPRGRHYVEARLPRSIAWSEVERLIESIDRRGEMGKRDYAIIVLIASYGLRAREVAALELDHFNWEGSQIRVPCRKGGHSTVYPLSKSVGEAIIEYLAVRRKDVPTRRLFLSMRSPRAPLHYWAISSLVGERLRKAGIIVHRGGSHTLRHSCIQHLVNANVPFQVIADYVGHRSPDSTLHYGRIATQRLRDLVAAPGEEAL